ncbi:hypothetical protein STSO111631_13585 [Stackebrandtia soli]
MARQRRRYGGSVLAVGAIGSIALVAGSPLADAMVVGAVVTTACVLADLVLMGLAHRAISTAKQSQRWYADTRQAVVTDTTLRTDPVPVPRWGLIGALAVIALTVVLGGLRYGELPRPLVYPGGESVPTTPWTAFGPVIVQLVLAAVILLVVLGVRRSRPDLDAARPIASARRYRLYLRAVYTTLFTTAIGGSLSLMLVALNLWAVIPDTPLWTIVAIVPMVVVAAGWLVLVFTVGDAGHRLPAVDGDEPADAAPQRTQHDDDRYWHLAGNVYFNRDDPAFLVHRRVGAGWTTNMAHPGSWVILAVVIALIALAAFGIIPNVHYRLTL